MGNVVFPPGIPLLNMIIYKISWNDVGWWLQQKQILSINNLVGHFLTIYKLSQKISSLWKILIWFLITEPDNIGPHWLLLYGHFSNISFVFYKINKVIDVWNNM